MDAMHGHYTLTVSTLLWREHDSWRLTLWQTGGRRPQAVAVAVADPADPYADVVAAADDDDGWNHFPAVFSVLAEPAALLDLLQRHI